MQPWEQLAAVKQRIAERWWFPGTSGNLAIRCDDDSFLVTASGIDKYIQTKESFVRVTNQGEPLEQRTPSLETLLHVEIFNRTNAGCSLHVHTVNNNVISNLYYKDGFVRFKDQELIKAFDLWKEDDELIIPIIDNPAHIPTLAEALSRHIHGDQGVVLIYNHGINVWARTAQEAFKLLEAAEFLFEFDIKLKQLSHPKGENNYGDNSFTEK